MFSVLEIKNKAEELRLNDYDLEQFFVSNYNYHYEWEIKNCPDSTRVEFYKFLLEKFNFKFLESKGGGENDNRDDYYESEDCYSIVELQGEIFKIEYSYRSYDGYNLNTVWDWKPVTAKQKTVTYYEPEKPVVMVEKQRTETYYE